MKIPVAFIVCMFVFIQVVAGCDCGSASSSGEGTDTAVMSATVSDSNVTSVKVYIPTPNISDSRFVCIVDTGLMKELDILVGRLGNAEEAGDSELQSALMEKIRRIKDEISLQTKDCQEASSYAGGGISVTVSESPQSGGGGVGYAVVSSSGGAGGYASSEPMPVSDIVVSKPVAVGSGSEITDYYKLRITKVMDDETPLDEKISGLKGLRDEIDDLIRSLIEKKDSLDAGELGDIVSEIKILPSRVVAGSVSVESTGKTVTAEVNKKNLEIVQSAGRVIVKDGNVEVYSDGVSIQNSTLKVGDMVVKLMPSEVVSITSIEPKSMELKVDSEKIVYKVQTEEDRKLFGFIPLKLNREVILDASDASTVSEVMPWWAFLTTE